MPTFICPPLTGNLFERLNVMGIVFENICKAFLFDIKYYAPWICEERPEEQFKQFLLLHKTEAEKGAAAFHFDEKMDIEYMHILYEKENSFSPMSLIEVLKSGTNKRTAYAEELLLSREKEMRVAIEALENSENKAGKKAASRILKQWDNAKGLIHAEKLQTVSELVQYIQNIWSFSRWSQFFIENPLMTGFAEGCVWEVQSMEGEEPVSFRYMEDGSFNTMDENEIFLSKENWISFYYPEEQNQEITERWIQLFEDYEIAQPFGQLTVSIPKLTAEEKEMKDWKVLNQPLPYTTFFKKKMREYSFQMKNIQKSWIFTQKDEPTGIEIQFTLGIIDFISHSANVENVFFLKDGIKLKLKEVPARLLSFVLMICITSYAKS